MRFLGDFNYWELNFFHMLESNTPTVSGDCVRWKLKKNGGFDQGCQYRTGGRTGLATGTIYFGYRSIPVYRFGFTAIFYIYKYIYIYIYVCMYVFVYIYIYIYYNKYKSLP